jgi:glycosyltransferase involved in cell wall biosynthesis
MNDSPAATPKPRLLLIFSQTFIPDPASVGQHIADVAIEMARRGHAVRVYTSARGYEDPTVKYPKRETIQGVDVRRLGLASFGKKSIFTRILGTFSFMIQCLWLALFTPRVGGIFFSTSPPLIGVAACIARFFRRVPIVYWAMDLNPDQLIMMGKIKADSLAARVLERVNRMILRRSARIFALDRFMAERLLQRGDYAAKISILPPWPHDDHMEPVERAHNPFRQKLGLQDKFVVMYSGNHSPANPLTTLLQAAVHFKDHPDLCFLFVGGGLGKREVEETIQKHGLKNALSLPYQPLADLGNSLSAADVHVVSLGDNMVGIIHPCKIYGAMSIARPILYFGPEPSHVTDIMEAYPIGRRVAHGDVAGAVAAIQGFLSSPEAERVEMGQTAHGAMAEKLSQARLCRDFCDLLDASLRPGTGPVPEGEARGSG